MGAQIVQSARLRPGKCAITGDVEGPFIDTETQIPRWGRVYLSVRGLQDSLRELGFLTPEETEVLRDDNDRLQEEVRRLTEVEEHYSTLLDAVSEHVQVEPEIREVEVTKTRAPSDEEVEEWISKKGADHPAVKNAKRLEAGSPEEWSELYGPIPPGHPDFRKSRIGEPKTVEDKAQEQKDLNLVPEANVVTVHDQEVDLNEVLDQNVGNVLAWAEGHDDSVKESLVEAEYTLADREGREPRKGVVEGLGYEMEEEEE